MHKFAKTLKNSVGKGSPLLRKGGGAMKRRLACAAIAAGMAFGANAAKDFYWTGGAGDHLWSSPANWSSTSGGANLGVGEGPDSSSHKYYFSSVASDLVVTQDIDVVIWSLGMSSAGSDEVRVKFVSADGCKMKLDGNQTWWIQNRLCLELNVDMSSDTQTADILWRSTEGQTQSRLVFNLKAANSGVRTLVFEDANRADVAEGSVMPNFAVSVGSEDSPQDPGLVILKSELAGETVLRDLRFGRNYTDNSSIRDKRYRIVADGGLAVDSGAGRATATNDLSGAVFSVADTLSLSFPKARPSVLHTLPNAKALAVDRTTTTIQTRPALVRWLFDDASNPVKDAYGMGEAFDRHPADDEGKKPKVVEDGERGAVLYFGAKGPCCLTPYNETNKALPGFAPTNGFSVAFWIRPDSDCDSAAKILYFGEWSSGRCLALRLNDTDGKYLMLSNNGNNKYLGTSDLRGAWHHIAITCTQAGNETVYIDGENAGTASCSNNMTPNHFWIGTIWEGWDTSGSKPYKGKMDDFVLVDYPMTAREVSELKEKGLASFMPVAEIAATATGCVAFDYASPAVAGLAGDSIAAAVKVGVEGSTLTVGSEARKAQTAYAGAITGENTTLVKVGSGYDLALSGAADAVTNIVVKEGTLTLNRATSVPGVIARYDFDEGNVETGTGYAPIALERKALTGGSGTISSVADRNGATGKAIHFPGGQILATTTNTGDASFPVGNDSYSISVWIKPTDSSNRPVFSMGSWSDDKLSLLRFNDSGAECSGLTFTTYGSQVDATGLSLGDGSWHHVVAAYDGSTGKKALYVDGVKTEQSGSRNLNLDSKPLYIGYRASGSNGYLGDMDEFVMFDHALTDAEVEILRTGTLEPGKTVLASEPDIDVEAGATLHVSSIEKAGFLRGAGTIVVEEGGRLVVDNGKGFTGTVTGPGYYKDLSKKGLVIFVQ